MKIYLESIKAARESNTFNFNSLKNILIKKGYDKKVICSKHFIYWFFTNFFIEGLNPIMVHDMNELNCFIEAVEKDLRETEKKIYIDKECYLKPEAHMFYEQSVLNKRLNTLSIILAFGGFIIGLISVFK